MPETGAAIAAWWEGLGTAEAAAGAASAGEAATAAGGADLALGAGAEGILGAEAAGAGLEAGLGTGLLEGGTAGEAGAAAGGIIPGSGPASTSLADTAAVTPTQSAAQNLIAGAPQELGAGPVAEEVPYGVNESSGLQNAAPAEKGLIGSAMDWVNAKPVNTLITGQAISGVAKGVAEERAADKKRKANLEALQEPQRQKQGNPSVGGKGVSLNLAPGGRILTRPDGSRVYVPNSGLINGAMNGVRG